MKMFTKFLILALAVSCSQVETKKTDGEWTTVSGKVTNVSPHSFVLMSGDKKILVEMDDYDWDADGYKLVKDDRVIVTGRVDNDLFEKRSIEAGSVYVKGLDTFFYANPADEEGAPVLSTHEIMTTTSLPDGASVRAQGKVTKVMDDEFIIDTGFRKLTVSVDKLSFNPLDDKGLVKVEEGDTVRASGEIDDDYFEGKELEARYILDFNS